MIRPKGKKMLNYFEYITNSSKVLGSLLLDQFLSKIKNTEQLIDRVLSNVEIIYHYISKVRYCEIFVDYWRIKVRVATINYVARHTNLGP